MTGYIRNPYTWKAVKVVNITAYQLPIETSQGETGTVTITGQIDSDYSRYVLTTEQFDHAFKITGQSTGDALQTTLTVEDCIGQLEHYAQMCSGDDSGNYGGELVFLIGRTRIDGKDRPVELNSRFAPPFIYIYRSELDAVATALSERNILRSDYVTKINDTWGYIDFDVMLRAIRRYGFSFSLKRENVHVDTTSGDISDLRDYDTLVIRIADVGNDVVVVPFEDGHSEVLSESYNDDVCSCVRCFDQNAGRYEYFLGDDGIVYYDDFAMQAKGYTSIATFNSTEATAEDTATAIFANNSHSHKIEFASDKQMHIGQPVRLMLKKGILDTTISKVMLNSGDERYRYTCGELPVTASERIRADNWEYCRRLPSNPRKGALYIIPD